MSAVSRSPKLGALACSVPGDDSDIEGEESVVTASEGTLSPPGVLVSTPLSRPAATGELFVEVVALVVPIVADVEGLSPRTARALLRRSGEVEDDDIDEETGRPEEEEEEDNEEAAVLPGCHSSQAADVQQVMFTTAPFRTRHLRLALTHWPRVLRGKVGMGVGFLDTRCKSRAEDSSTVASGAAASAASAAAVPAGASVSAVPTAAGTAIAVPTAAAAIVDTVAGGGNVTFAGGAPWLKDGLI